MPCCREVPCDVLACWTDTKGELYHRDSCSTLYTEPLYPSHGSTAAQRHDIGELTCFRRGGFQYSAACGDNLVEALRGKGPEVAVDVDEACHPDPDPSHNPDPTP